MSHKHEHVHQQSKDAAEQKEAKQLVDKIASEYQGDHSQIGTDVRRLQGLDRKHWQQNLKAMNEEVVSKGFPDPKIIGVDNKGHLLTEDGKGQIQTRKPDTTLISSGPDITLGTTKPRKFTPGTINGVPVLSYKVQDGDNLSSISASMNESTNGIGTDGKQIKVTGNENWRHYQQEVAPLNKVKDTNKIKTGDNLLFPMPRAFGAVTPDDAKPEAAPQPTKQEDKGAADAQKPDPDADKKRIADEQIEKDRLAAEAEKQRIHDEQVEKGRIAAEAEKQRIHNEQVEKDRMAAEAEKKRIADAEAEKQRLAAEEARKRVEAPVKVVESPAFTAPSTFRNPDGKLTPVNVAPDHDVPSKLEQQKFTSVVYPTESFMAPKVPGSDAARLQNYNGAEGTGNFMQGVVLNDARITSAALPNGGQSQMIVYGDQTGNKPMLNVVTGIDKDGKYVGVRLPWVSRVETTTRPDKTSSTVFNYGRNQTFKLENRPDGLPSAWEEQK